MSDTLVTQARRFNREAGLAATLAAQHRAARDNAVRRLRAEDPQRWTYPAIAEATGLGVELVAAIIQGRSGRRKSRTSARPR